MQKIVINVEYGGFGILDQFLPLFNVEGSWDIRRDDPLLISLIESHGARNVQDAYASLKIVEIPDNVEWTICEYDGIEWVAERHRIWT